MFIGHFALGYAAKRLAPRVSLAVLFFAAQFADLLWPVLLALGVEHVRIVTGETPFLNLAFDRYPYSHSLLMLVIWGIAFGGIYRLVTGDRRALPVLFALVVSHWLLDFVTHRPDVPLVPNGATYGLGLWFSATWTLAVEFTLFAVGVGMYARATRPRDAIGRWSFAGSCCCWRAAISHPSVHRRPPWPPCGYLRSSGLHSSWCSVGGQTGTARRRRLKAQSLIFRLR